MQIFHSDRKKTKKLVGLESEVWDTYKLYTSKYHPSYLILRGNKQHKNPTPFGIEEVVAVWLYKPCADLVSTDPPPIKLRPQRSGRFLGECRNVFATLNLSMSNQSSWGQSVKVIFLDSDSRFSYRQSIRNHRSIVTVYGYIDRIVTIEPFQSLQITSVGNCTYYNFTCSFGPPKKQACWLLAKNTAHGKGDGIFAATNPQT